MRISDWSSDVCSSDLDLCAKAAIPNDTTAEISQLVAAISEPGLVDTLGNSPALYAVMADDAAQLDRLLELGYDTSIPDGSLLHAAAFWNSVNSADRLLDKGIDPNVKNTGGSTPLMVAVSEGGPDRSEEHTSELQSLMRLSYAVFC